MDALGAEFPGVRGALGLARRPAVARELPLAALVSGVGAAFVVRAIAQLAVVPTYGLLFPLTEPHPSWLTPRLLMDAPAEGAAGMVLARAGGRAAVLAYVLLELLVLAAALPARLFFCGRSPQPSDPGACSYAASVVDRWPLWLALAAGVLAHRLLATRGEGSNQLLRAAGAFSLVITVAANGWSIWLVTHFPAGGSTGSVTYAAGQVVAGAVAGTLLWRSSLARPLLLAILLAGPTFTFGIQSLRQNPLPAHMPLELLLTSLASVIVPAAAVLALFAGRWARGFLEPTASDVV